MCQNQAGAIEIRMIGEIEEVGAKNHVYSFAQAEVALQA